MTAQHQPAPTAARARYVIFGLKFRHWIPISRTFETAEQARRYAETLPTDVPTQIREVAGA
jgi:hypothetical protein